MTGGERQQAGTGTGTATDAATLAATWPRIDLDTRITLAAITVAGFGEDGDAARIERGAALARTYGYTFAPGDTYTVEDDDFRTVILMEHDGDVSPVEYPDGYDATDVAAWGNDDWCFLTLKATTSVLGVELSTEYTCGVESHSDLDYFLTLFAELAETGRACAKEQVADLADAIK